MKSFSALSGDAASVPCRPCWHSQHRESTSSSPYCFLYGPRKVSSALPGASLGSGAVHKQSWRPQSQAPFKARARSSIGGACNCRVKLQGAASTNLWQLPERRVCESWTPCSACARLCNLLEGLAADILVHRSLLTSVVRTSVFTLAPHANKASNFIERACV